MITQEKIEQLISIIVNKVEPEKILLFGSYAGGAVDKNSDLDLLIIVKESNEPRIKRARNLRRLLWGIISEPKDILIYTEEEIEKWADVRFSFISEILNNSVLLYERAN